MKHELLDAFTSLLARSHESATARALAMLAGQATERTLLPFGRALAAVLDQPGPIDDMPTAMVLALDLLEAVARSHGDMATDLARLAGVGVIAHEAKLHDMSEAYLLECWLGSQDKKREHGQRTGYAPMLPLCSTLANQLDAWHRRDRIMLSHHVCRLQAAGDDELYMHEVKRSLLDTPAQAWSTLRKLTLHDAPDIRAEHDYVHAGAELVHAFALRAHEHKDLRPRAVDAMWCLARLALSTREGEGVVPPGVYAELERIRDLTA